MKISRVSKVRLQIAYENIINALKANNVKYITKNNIIQTYIPGSTDENGKPIQKPQPGEEGTGTAWIKCFFGDRKQVYIYFCCHLVDCYTCKYDRYITVYNYTDDIRDTNINGETPITAYTMLPNDMELLDPTTLYFTTNPMGKTFTFTYKSDSGDDVSHTYLFNFYQFYMDIYRDSDKNLIPMYSYDINNIVAVNSYSQIGHYVDENGTDDVTDENTVYILPEWDNDVPTFKYYKTSYINTEGKYIPIEMLATVKEPSEESIISALISYDADSNATNSLVDPSLQLTNFLLGQVAIANYTIHCKIQSFPDITNINSVLNFIFYKNRNLPIINVNNTLAVANKPYYIDYSFTNTNNLILSDFSNTDTATNYATLDGPFPAGSTNPIDSTIGMIQTSGTTSSSLLSMPKIMISTNIDSEFNMMVQPPVYIGQDTLIAFKNSESIYPDNKLILFDRLYIIMDLTLQISANPEYDANKLPNNMVGQIRSLVIPVIKYKDINKNIHKIYSLTYNTDSNNDTGGCNFKLIQSGWLRNSVDDSTTPYYTTNLSTGYLTGKYVFAIDPGTYAGDQITEFYVATESNNDDIAYTNEEDDYVYPFLQGFELSCKVQAVANAYIDQDALESNPSEAYNYLTKIFKYIPVDYNYNGIQDGIFYKYIPEYNSYITKYLFYRQNHKNYMSYVDVNTIDTYENNIARTDKFDKQFFTAVNNSKLQSIYTKINTMEEMMTCPFCASTPTINCSYCNNKRVLSTYLIRHYQPEDGAYNLHIPCSMVKKGQDEHVTYHSSLWNPAWRCRECAGTAVKIKYLYYDCLEFKDISTYVDKVPASCDLSVTPTIEQIEALTVDNNGVIMSYLNYMLQKYYSLKFDEDQLTTVVDKYEQYYAEILSKIVFYKFNGSFTKYYYLSSTGLIEVPYGYNYIYSVKQYTQKEWDTVKNTVTDNTVLYRVDSDKVLTDDNIGFYVFSRRDLDLSSVGRRFYRIYFENKYITSLWEDNPENPDFNMFFETVQDIDHEYHQHDPNDNNLVELICTTCEGSGKVGVATCPDCNGSGLNPELADVVPNVPFPDASDDTINKLYKYTTKKPITCSNISYEVKYEMNPEIKEDP